MKNRRTECYISILAAGLFLVLALVSCAQATATPSPEPAPTEMPAATEAPAGETSAQDSLPADALEAFDFVIERKLDAVPMAGLSLGIRWGDRPVYLKGYGLSDIAVSTTTDESTLYPIASLTKQFTAAAIMQLVEQGKIDLDDPVTRFFPDAPEEWDDVRIHNLLNHSSGIPDVEELGPGQVEAEYLHPNNAEDLVQALRMVPLLFQPGSQFRYGSSGYSLLGGIIGQVTGLPSEDYFQENIFAPLGMDSTTKCLQEISEIAQGYVVEDGALSPVISYDPTGMLGAAGLCSTVVDLIKWQQALVEGRVISLESYETMTSPTGLSDGSTVPYGYGLGLGQDFVAHGGSAPGFHAYMIYYTQDELALVLLANTAAPSGRTLDILAEVMADRLISDSP